MTEAKVLKSHGLKTSLLYGPSFHTNSFRDVAYQYIYSEPLLPSSHTNRISFY